MPQTKDELIENITAHAAMVFLFFVLLTFVYMWVEQLTEPTKHEVKIREARQCVILSERTDLAIAECYLKSDLPIPDDI